VVGAVVVSSLALLAIILLSIGRSIEVASANGMTAFLLIVFGASLHLFLDSLAFPGIPLFYPASARKITLGIFPGPSLLLMMITIGYLLLVVSGMATLTENTLYISVCLSVIGIRTVLKMYTAFTIPGTTIPTINPLVWWVIDEEADAYMLSSFRVGRGITGTKNLKNSRD
jgi:inner membrane protein